MSISQLVLVSRETRTVLTLSFFENTQAEKVVERSGQPEERNSSNAQIRTLLDEQRQMIIAEYCEKIGQHELQAAHCEEERCVLREQLWGQQMDFREAHQQSRQRTKRSVYSITMHVHARALVQRTSHCMWRTSHMHALSPRGHFGQGGFCFFGSRQVLSFPSSLRKMAEEGGRKWLPVHVRAVSPRELTGTTALQRGIPPGARGGIQILGMVQNMNNVVAVLTAVVVAAAFSSVDKQKLVALVQGRPSSNDDDEELFARVVVACKSRSSNIVVVLSDSLDKAQTKIATTPATPSRTLLTASRCSSSLLRTSLHNSMGL